MHSELPVQRSLLMRTENFRVIKELVAATAPRQLNEEDSIAYFQQVRMKSERLYDRFFFGLLSPFGSEEIDLPELIDGVIDLQMPAGTQPGTTLRAEGKGAPKLNNVNVRGSHYVKVKVEIPQKISNKERELVEQLKATAK